MSRTIMGADYTYDLQPGEAWERLTDGRIIVCHRDRAPKFVSAEGEQEVKWEAARGALHDEGKGGDMAVYNLFEGGEMLKVGCISTERPCEHQKKHPLTICGTCAGVRRPWGSQLADQWDEARDGPYRPEMISWDEVRQGARRGLRKWAEERGLTGGKRMTRQDAIGRVAEIGGADVDGAETFVNGLVALGLLDLDEAPHSATAAAAKALEGMPYGDVDGMSYGLASTIILRLIAKGFTISRA